MIKTCGSSIKMLRGSEDIAPCNLNLGTRWKCIVSFTPGTPESCHTYLFVYYCASVASCEHGNEPSDSIKDGEFLD